MPSTVPKKKIFLAAMPARGATILFRDPRSTDHAPVAEIL
jgi:hypothetical protein